MTAAMFIMLGLLIALIAVIFSISGELKKEKYANEELQQSNEDLLKVNENLYKENESLQKQLDYRRD